MRKDMKHVIIDRPRLGGNFGKAAEKGYAKRTQKEMAAEDGHHKGEKVKARYKPHYQKQLNEHLSPLYRWMRKQVGRDWDAVWSEVCSGLSVRNATTSHVRDHAIQMVERNCQMIDGKVHDSLGYELRYERWCELYVHPVTNILSSLPKREIEKKERNWFTGDNDLHRYYKIDGEWFECFFSAFDGWSQREYKDLGYTLWASKRQFDELQERFIHDVEAHYTYWKKIYCKSKLVISPKRARKLGLDKRLEEVNAK